MVHLTRFFAFSFLLLGSISVASMNLASAEEAVPQTQGQITLSFAPLVKRVAPAVVNIYTQRVVRQQMSPIFSDPFFRQFFGHDAGDGFSRQRLENSLGSGVIVRSDGLIVTSNHVIKDADEIRVVLSDRREFDASLVTADDHADLAVLRVDTKGQKLPALELKDSDDAEIGDLVLAIGNPFGVGQTVTNGIISAVSHNTHAAGDFDYFIQTDAPINPGNSGGALVTMDGRLVGINASIYSETGGSLGIGFAVPSNMVRVLINAVEAGKKNITHPWLGVDGQVVTPELAASMNMDEPTGFLVTSINPSSPAKDLRTGDVIVSVNGRKVEDPEAFRYRIATLSIDGEVKLGIIRKSQPMNIVFRLIAPPETPPRHTTVMAGHTPFSGATLENLSPAVAEEEGLHGLDTGVIITAIADDSLAANVGLETGDIIFQINSRKIRTIEDVSSALNRDDNSEGGRGWRLSIQRGSSTITMVVGG